MPFPNWNDCTPEQKEQRRINFGGAPAPIERTDAYNVELVRRYLAGETLSRADAKAARRLIREARPNGYRPSVGMRPHHGWRLGLTKGPESSRGLKQTRAGSAYGGGFPGEVGR